MVTLGEVKEDLVEILFWEGKEEGDDTCFTYFAKLPMVDKWKLKGNTHFPYILPRLSIMT